MTVHNSRADSPITTQKTTVLTVEFTKKLLKNWATAACPATRRSYTLD
jgi:hypothetical protein